MLSTNSHQILQPQLLQSHPDDAEIARDEALSVAVKTGKATSKSPLRGEDNRLAAGKYKKQNAAMNKAASKELQA